MSSRDSHLVALREYALGATVASVIVAVRV